MKEVKKVLVTEYERINMPFKEVGSEMSKIKVVDLKAVGDKIKKYREENNMSPFIEFHAVKYDKRKGFNYTHTYEKDPMTGIYYGIIIGQHTDGNPIWKKIPMGTFERLNINLDSDMEKWIILRMCSYVLGSPFHLFNENDPLENVKYKIYDSEEEAREKLDNARDIGDAIERINKLRGTKLFDFARFLGLDVLHGMNDNVIKGYMIDFALKNADEFNRKWNHETRGICETFFNAVKSGIIKHEYAQGYEYKGISLGIGEDDSINFLKNDAKILTTIQIDIDKNDTVRNEYSKLIENIEKKSENKSEVMNEEKPVVDEDNKDTGKKTKK